MEYGRERKPMKQEDVWKLWQQSILSITSNYEKAPEVLKIDDIVIGTLGNFSASIGKAKSKKTFNVSAIVAAALKNGVALNYSASRSESRKWAAICKRSWRCSAAHDPM